MFIKLASFFMLTGVALGAFGAHALKAKLSEHALEVFKTGVLYQFIHGLGLFAISWLISQSPNPKLTAAGIFMSLGIVLFSGSLYLLSTTGWKWLGPITPLGGLCFLIAWGLVFISA